MSFDTEFCASLIHTLCGISLHKITHTPTGWLDFLTKSGIPFAPSHMEYLKKRTQQFYPQPFCIYEINLMQNIFVTCFCDCSCREIYMLGPALSQPLSEQELRSLLSRVDVSEELSQKLLHYTASLTEVSQDLVYKLAVVLVQKICGDGTPLVHRSVNLLWEMPTVLWENDNIPLPPDIRNVESRYEFSKVLTEAVRQGNYSLATQIFQNQTPQTMLAARNSSPLRNLQNLCIIANTQMRHTLEDSGIHPYKLDQLSHAIGLEVEHLQSLKEAEACLHRIFRRYCQLVQDYNFPDLPPLVHMAVTYVKDHLAETITVKDTAKAMTVNANYLSGVFRKHMGLSFIEFLNRERVRQAATLLKRSNLQIQQIATLVGYNNTSYFDKQFFREYHQSPQQYRQNGPL